MKYMLDTNIIIYAIKHNPLNVYERLKSIDENDLCISSITYSELMYGVEKSKHSNQNRVALLIMLARIHVVDFDMKAAEEYGRIRATLESNGSVIGSMDLLIASHAKSRGLTLVTNNVKEFKRVEGLAIENWA